MLGVVQAIADINQWVTELPAEQVCNFQSQTRTTCVIDYSRANHNVEEACLAVGAIYMTSEFVFRCSANGADLFYTAKDFPACFGFSCNVEGSYGLQTEDTESQRVGMAEAMGMECSQLRLDFGEPIIPVAAPKNCDEDTEIIMSSLQQYTTQEGINPYNIDTSAITEYCIEEGGDGGGTSLSCNIDFAMFDTANAESNVTMESECVELNGKYLEVDYSLSCDDVESEDTMVLFIEHQPLCVSTTFCQVDDFEVWASKNAESLIESLANEGWSCSTTYGPEVDDFAPSSPPTISASPTISPAPTSLPTISPAPTASPAPSFAPTTMGCLAASQGLNNTAEIQSVHAELQTQVLQIALSSYCRYPVSNDLPYVVNCEIDFNMFPNDMQSTCEALNDDEEDPATMYVEDTLFLFCSNDARHHYWVTITDRPSCRPTGTCNTKELKEADAVGLEWMISYFEASADSMNCIVDQARIKVGGEEGLGETDISQECNGESSVLDTTISIYNQKSQFHRNFKDYVAVNDLREIGCYNQPGGLLRCDVDFAGFEDAPMLEAECDSNAGSYLEYSFILECEGGENRRFLMVSENVPGCVGTICSPGQSYHALEPDVEWVIEHYASWGWTCTASINDVFMRDYDTKQASSPVISSEEDPTSPENPGSGSTTPGGGGGGGGGGLGGSSQSSEGGYVPGKPPPGLVGPQFHAIWLTQAPSAAPTGEDDWDDGNGRSDDGGCWWCWLLLVIAILLCCCLGGEYYRRRRQKELQKNDDDDDKDEDRTADGSEDRLLTDNIDELSDGDYEDEDSEDENENQLIVATEGTVEEYEEHGSPIGNKGGALIEYDEENAQDRTEGSREECNEQYRDENPDDEASPYDEYGGYYDEDGNYWDEAGYCWEPNGDCWDPDGNYCGRSG